jgi:hypothetical protein
MNQQNSEYKPDDSETKAIDFSGLVLGLSSAALSYLGHLAGQKPSESSVNLELAKQNIEILRMLLEKTKGNLNSEEDKLIRQVVADLQVRYVDALKYTAKAAQK